jgi:tagatose-6-phosphate ketose/aldose isomerase
LVTISTTVESSDWLRELRARQPEAARLLDAPVEEQQARGYRYTLAEILQQPSTWIHTAGRMSTKGVELERLIAGIRNLVLTGSGSSEYAGDCVRRYLQEQLGVAAFAIAGGALLTQPQRALPPERPGLVISLARSGDSPESVGVVSMLLNNEPELRHLVLTCNAEGKLATQFSCDARVKVVALDDGTNDRSLVMTSSFTNLVIAAYFLGNLQAPEQYRVRCTKLSSLVARLLQEHFGSIAHVAELDFRRALFLGTGARFGAAREASLKMLEMTAGRVASLAETYLGLRHGPMSYVHPDTLIVCFLSSDPTAQAYECDLIRELNDKTLGMAKVIVGENIPQIFHQHDLVMDCAGIHEIGDDLAALVDVVVGQLLAFFRCVREGLRPDSPSESGIINRVVQQFTLHLPEAPDKVDFGGGR